MGYVNKVTSGMDATTELELLHSLLHACHIFLQRWNVWTTPRTEEADAAFLAVTNLEKELRDRRDELYRDLGKDVVPF